MGAELQLLALKLADATARSYIESFCRWDGDWLNPKKRTSDCSKDVSDALRYIKLRGDSLPYRVIRAGALIRFESKA